MWKREKKHKKKKKKRKIRLEGDDAVDLFSDDEEDVEAKKEPEKNGKSKISKK